jgi:hypothetical protein
MISKGRIKLAHLHNEKGVIGINLIEYCLVWD